MRMVCLWSVGLSLILGSTLVSAQSASQPNERQFRELSDEQADIVVTATRFPTALRQSGASMTVITDAQIQRRQDKDLAQVMRGRPGVDVTQSGSMGTDTDIYIRGAESYQTLIRVDGMPVDDPSTIRGGPDISQFLMLNPEQIEIMRGPGSTLYGSQAMGGVVNIQTARGRGKPTFTVDTEFGSFYTAMETANSQGEVGLFNYNITLMRVDSQGYSICPGGENDPYRNTSLAVRFGIGDDNAGMDFFGRMVNAMVNFDNLPFDQAGNRTEHTNLFFKASPYLNLVDGDWQQRLSVYHTSHDRSTVDVNWGNSGYTGQILGMDYQSTIQFGEIDTLVAGVNYQHQSFDVAGLNAPQTRNTVGVYLENRLALWERLFASVGVRVDHVNDFGTTPTLTGSIAYLMPETDTRLHSRIGTAWRAPSLFNMYDPLWGSGNPNLRPEHSWGADLGVDQSFWDERVTVGVTGFYNKYRSLIQFNSSTFTNDNIGAARTSGIESYLQVSPIDDLMFAANYTYLETKNVDTDEALIYRPKHKFSVSGTWYFLEGRGTVSGQFDFVGARAADVPFVWQPPSRTTMASYCVVNLQASYWVTDWFQIHAKINNALDRKYSQINGTQAPRIGLYFGGKMTF